MKPEKALAELEDSIEKSSDAGFTPEVKRKFSEKVKETKEKIRTPLDTDKWIYRSVVGFLGLAILGCLAFTFLLSGKAIDPGTEVKIPEIFLAIGSAAVGALAGLLAPSPARGASE